MRSATIPQPKSPYLVGPTGLSGLARYTCPPRGPLAQLGERRPCTAWPDRKPPLKTQETKRRKDRRSATRSATPARGEAGCLDSQRRCWRFRACWWSSSAQGHCRYSMARDLGIVRGRRMNGSAAYTEASYGSNVLVKAKLAERSRAGGAIATQLGLRGGHWGAPP